MPLATAPGRADDERERLDVHLPVADLQVRVGADGSADACQQRGRDRRCRGLRARQDGVDEPTQRVLDVQASHRRGVEQPGRVGDELQLAVQDSEGDRTLHVFTTCELCTQIIGRLEVHRISLGGGESTCERLGSSVRKLKGRRAENARMPTVST